jgi:tetratricopeptide (TPR) repeat protein
VHPSSGREFSKKWRWWREGGVSSLPVTAYTLGDVARICKVSRSRLRYWERTALLEASERVDTKPAYAFRDLVAVKSVLDLLARGVPLRRIRRSAEAVRIRMPEVDYPLGALRMWADGSGRVVLRHGGRLVEPNGQMVLDFSEGGGGAEVEALEPRGAPGSKERALKRAEEWFDRGCSLDSDRATYAEAIEAYEHAIEAYPGFADAYCNLGSVYFNQGRRSPARACFECAIEIEPNHLEANLNLATLEEEVGRDGVALRHYKIALKADPLYADTHVSVALLYERLGVRSKALHHWRRYLQLDPSGLWSEVARQRFGE